MKVEVMPAIAKCLSHRLPKARTTILAATLIGASALAGSTSPSSAFVDAWPQAAHPLDRHAPSGANVIGRGIGGLHGRLAADMAMAACRDRVGSDDPSTGSFQDGGERPCP